MVPARHGRFAWAVLAAGLLLVGLVLAGCGDDGIGEEPGAGIAAWLPPPEEFGPVRLPRKNLAPPLPPDTSVLDGWAVVVEAGYAMDDEVRVYWEDGIGAPALAEGPGHLRLVRRFHSEEAFTSFTGSFVIDRDGHDTESVRVDGGGCDVVAALGYDLDEWRVAIHRTRRDRHGRRYTTLSCARRLPPPRPVGFRYGSPAMVDLAHRTHAWPVVMSAAPLHVERDGRTHVPDEISPRDDRAVLGLYAAWPTDRPSKGLWTRWTIETEERRVDFAVGFRYCHGDDRAGGDVRYETGDPLQGVSCVWDDGSSGVWIY